MVANAPLEEGTEGPGISTTFRALSRSGKNRLFKTRKSYLNGRVRTRAVVITGIGGKERFLNFQLHRFRPPASVRKTQKASCHGGRTLYAQPHPIGGFSVLGYPSIDYSPCNIPLIKLGPAEPGFGLVSFG